MMQMYLADGTTRSINQVAFGEPYTAQFKLLSLSTKIPNLVKTYVSWVFITLFQLINKKEPRLAKILNSSMELKVGQMFEKFY